MIKLNKYVTVAVVVLCIGAASSVIANKSKEDIPNAKPIRLFTPAPVIDYEIKAKFAIFTNSTFRDFSNPMYKNLSKEIYLPSDKANEITIKKANSKWKDFFVTLPMKLTEDCLTTGTKQNFCTNSSSSLKFFVNGVPDADALEKVINENDKLLVSFGPKTADTNKELDKLNQI